MNSTSNSYYETIGSLHGNRRVLIGTGRIIIGADNTSTTFLGQISAARGLAEDSPEASYRLVKVGKGELILAGNNEPGLLTVVDRRPSRREWCAERDGRPRSRRQG